MARKYVIRLDDGVAFGKYKNTKKEWWWIIENDPSYVEWVLENIDGAELDNEAYEAYQKRLKR